MVVRAAKFCISEIVSESMNGTASDQKLGLTDGNGGHNDCCVCENMKMSNSAVTSTGIII